MGQMLRQQQDDSEGVWECGCPTRKRHAGRDTDSLLGVMWPRWYVRNQHHFVFLTNFMVNGKAWSGISFCFSITYLHVLNWLQWEYTIKQQQRKRL